MTLSECMQKVSHREYLTWQEWFLLDMNQPSRTDYYLMQIANYLLSIPPMVWGKDPMQLDLSKFKIPFEFSEKPSQQQGPHSPQESQGMTQEQIDEATAKMVEQRWMFAVGAHRQKGRDPNGRNRSGN